MFLAYFIIILTTFAMQTLTLKIATGFSLLVVPGLLIIYTYALFNVKCMSGSRVGIIGATNRREGGDEAEE